MGILDVAISVITPQMFGATGRGEDEHDDTESFKMCLAALADTETANAARTLYIPRGEYIISETLEINHKNGIKIFGDGNFDGGTEIYYKGPAGDVIRFSNCTGVDMHNINIICDKDVLATGIALDVPTIVEGETVDVAASACKHVRIHDVNINYARKGIAIKTPCTFCDFERVHVSIPPNSIGILVGDELTGDGLGAINFISCVFQYDYRNELALDEAERKTSATCGICIQNGKMLSIHRCFFNGVNTGLLFYALSKITNITIADNAFNDILTFAVNIFSAQANISMLTFLCNKYNLSDATFIKTDGAGNPSYMATGVLFENETVTGSTSVSYELDKCQLTLSNIRSDIDLISSASIGAETIVIISKPKRKVMTALATEPTIIESKLEYMAYPTSLKPAIPEIPIGVTVNYKDVSPNSNVEFWETVITADADATYDDLPIYY